MLNASLLFAHGRNNSVQCQYNNYDDRMYNAYSGSSLLRPTMGLNKSDFSTEVTILAGPTSYYFGK